MATTEALSSFSSAGAGEAEQFEYRAFSTSAIASIIFGVMSPLTILAGRDSLEYALLLCPIPILGLLLGFYALAKIRVMPDQLVGKKAAIGGIVLSLVGLVGGLSVASYVHATEVPEGATRTSFQEFRPDDRDERAGIPIPKEVQALNGKRVFIKGYFRQDSSPISRNVKSFLLVRDNNQCCFGDLSSVKYYDQVKVDLADKLTTDYSSRLFRVAGTLRIEPQSLMPGSQRPVYYLDADYVQ
jgi:hypothetical protein